MIAGVPGIGISGLFYLLSAFLMPFFELALTVRGKSNMKRWKFVAKHHLYFWGILFGSYAIVVLLEIGAEEICGVTLFSKESRDLISIAPVIITLSLLFSVLGGVKLLRLAGNLRASANK